MGAAPSPPDPATGAPRSKRMSNSGRKKSDRMSRERRILASPENEGIPTSSCMMDLYDEDLTQNKFYQTLRNQFQKLYDEVTRQRLLLCIPRVGALSDGSLDNSDFENHILIPIEGRATVFSTLNKKEVNIKSGIITTGSGFEGTRTVTVLFEETFFNENDESYRVLCISQLLEGGEDTPDETSERLLPLVNFQTLEECAEMLWGSTGNTRMQRYLDDLSGIFVKSLKRLENDPLRHIISATEKYYDKALDIVLKDNLLKKKTTNNPTFMENIRIATETYIMHGVYRRLFRTICSCLAAKDSHLNKITRNLAHELQLRDMGVRMEFCQNVPRARKEMTSLSRYTTPLGKLTCLKRIFTALMRKTGSAESIPLTTDDLLPILVFLVVKADMPNWCANFVYMANFRFSGSNNDDEYGFYLATLEAALEHTSSGNLCDIELSVDVSKPFQLSINGKSEDITHQLPESQTLIEKLFRYIKEDNRDAINELLNGNPKKTPSPMPNNSPSSTLCHPLCVCERCSQIQNMRSQKHTAPVTVHSRDDKGWTVLHIAAYYGHIIMTDILLHKGAVVNACDYHGTTPLHLACQRGHQAVALLLLHYNSGLNLHDTDGNTALHLATLNGHDDCVKALVYSDQGSGLLDLDAVNDFGDTSMHLAAKWGYMVIIELLIENGARVLIRNRKNRLPVHNAHNCKVQNLLNEIAEKQVNNRVETVAKIALRRHSPPVSSRPIIPPSDQISPSDAHKHSIPTDRRKSFSKMTPGLKKEIKQPTVTEKRMEKLLKAIADGDIHMTKLHLGWASESDEEDDVDLSQKPLCHPLCQCEKCQPVQKFTSATDTGIHLNMADSLGRTALHVAALHGHETLVEMFLKRGAEVDARNSSHESTPLHLATKQDNMQVVKLLVAYNAEVNSKDSQGNTPLHYTVIDGSDPKTNFLIQKGANVNMTNKRGNTPLHEAMKWNFENIAKLLIKNNADTRVLNRQSLTYEDLAQSDTMLGVLKHTSRDRSVSAESDHTSVPSGLDEHHFTDERPAAADPDQLLNLKQVLDTIDDYEVYGSMTRSETFDVSGAEPAQRRTLRRGRTLDKLESEEFIAACLHENTVVDFRAAIKPEATNESNYPIKGDIGENEVESSSDYSVIARSNQCTNISVDSRPPEHEPGRHTERISSSGYEACTVTNPHAEKGAACQPGTDTNDIYRVAALHERQIDECNDISEYVTRGNCRGADERVDGPVPAPADVDAAQTQFPPARRRVMREDGGQTAGPGHQIPAQPPRSTPPPGSNTARSTPPPGPDQESDL